MSNDDIGTASAQAQVAHLEMQSTANMAMPQVSSGRSSMTIGARRASDVSSQVKDELRAAKSQVVALQKAAAQAKADLEKREAQMTQLTTKYDREVATTRELQTALKTAEHHLAILKKEIVVIQHNFRANEKHEGIATVEVLQEQLVKTTKELDDLRVVVASDRAQQEVACLTEENKSLQRQRTDFINCLRKQNKLIDVLKRQILHLEAAKMLQLTEAEFLGALEGRQP
jgi:hypothetical protein